MFEKIKNCLDEFERIIKEVEKTYECTEEEGYILDYFELNLAKALMQNGHIDSRKVADVIIAIKGDNYES